MIFHASVERSEQGDYVARCHDPSASARGLSARSALERLRLELRYQIELCPCSGVEDDYVELRVEE